MIARQSQPGPTAVAAACMCSGLKANACPSREHVSGSRTLASTGQGQCAPQPGVCETGSRLGQTVAGLCHPTPGTCEAGSRLRQIVAGLCYPMPGVCEAGSRPRQIVAGLRHPTPGICEAGSRCMRAATGSVQRSFKRLSADPGTVRAWLKMCARWPQGMGRCPREVGKPPPEAAVRGLAPAKPRFPAGSGYF